MPQPNKWRPPTVAEEWSRILKAEDQVILEAYVKAKDPAAIAYQAAKENTDIKDSPRF